MKKHSVLFLVFCAFTIADASAQYYPPPRVIIRGGVRARPQRPQQRQTRVKAPPFQPTVNLSFGYGFPNTDQYFLTSFYNAYKGNISQVGPFTGSVDYQFSRTMSIGVLATYGKVSAPYYDYNNRGFDSPAFTGKLQSTSIMLNWVNYIPVNQKIMPYFKIAAGANIWNQDYVDESGQKMNYIELPSAFAYQASFGARFSLSKQAGLFIEAGYGKYILNGGLSIKL